MSTPSTAMARPLSLDSPEKLMIVANPSTITAMFSGGPKCSAKCAMGGATTASRIREMMAATKDPMAAMARAGPARPCRAIW
jgi:hypothetical protein